MNLKVKNNRLYDNSTSRTALVGGFVLFLIAVFVLIPVSLHMGTNKARDLALNSGFSTVTSTSVKLFSFCPKDAVGFVVEGTDSNGKIRTADACVYSIDPFGNSFIRG